MIAFARKTAIAAAMFGVCLPGLVPAHAQVTPALVEQAKDAAAADRNVDALSAYADAIAAAPNDPSIYAARAYLFEMLGQPALAARDYATAARLDPNDAGVQTKLCLYLSLTNHDLDGALAACDAAVRIQPLDAVTLGTRGYAHLRRGEFDKAETDYQASLAQSSASPDEMFGLGVAMIHLGRVRQGREQIASATLDSAGLVDQWQARGFGLLGEVIPGPAPTSASQPAISVSTSVVLLNKGETYMSLANGCGRVVSGAPGASTPWTGRCRFGLAHGEQDGARFAYGRQIAGPDGAALEKKLARAYQAAEQALAP